MSLNQLSLEWRAWTRANVACGRSRETMLPRLIEGGHASALARRALDRPQMAARGHLLSLEEAAR